MDNYGWLSIVPPIVAIALAIKTKQVYLSLGLFIFLGWTIMSGWNPVIGMIRSVETYLEQGTAADNARVLLFSSLIGAMITLTQASGGMEGFVNRVDERGLAKSKRSVGLLTMAVSFCVFLESNFSLLVTGSVARPLFDKCRISREKLAYIIDATCAPKLILIPLNAWGAYITGLLLAQDVANANTLLFAALSFNFYAILAIALALFVVITGWNIGPMREAERRVSEEGKLLRDGAEPLVSEEVSTTRAEAGVPKRAVNMVMPIIVMVVTVPIVLWMTGDGSIPNGSGSQAVLWGVIVGLMVAVAMYRLQGIMTVKQSTDHIIKGIQGLLPPGAHGDHTTASGEHLLYVSGDPVEGRIGGHDHHHRPAYPGQRSV